MTEMALQNVEFFIIDSATVWAMSEVQYSDYVLMWFLVPSDTGSFTKLLDVVTGLKSGLIRYFFEILVEVDPLNSIDFFSFR